MKDTLPKKQPPAPANQPPDGDLVDRAKDGDLSAMDELISRHHGSVFRTAVGILGDDDAASDVAQETFLKAFRGLGKFRGEASFKTWVLAIAANEAKGLLRKAGRRKELSLERVGPVSSEEMPIDETMARDEDTRRMKEMLSQLPEKQRQAVTLRIFEDLSFREIGAVIGSSEGAARVNYHHGIRRLKEMSK